jgi:hypothetical protein
MIYLAIRNVPFWLRNVVLIVNLLVLAGRNITVRLGIRATRLTVWTTFPSIFS